MAFMSVERVEKPWGHELIWARTEAYVGKILHIRAGESLSLQYHEVKDETIHVLSGRLRFRWGESEKKLEETVLEAGQSRRIPPRLVHQMEALTTCDVLEASTPQLQDVIRLSDRYGRVDGVTP